MAFQRITRAEWDLPQRDLEPQNCAGTLVRYVRHEQQLGLVVYGQYGVALGVLALRCDTSGRPLSAALA